jgi:ABC-type glycerol-3-phosphate transport system substrate-binding protein
MRVSKLISGVALAVGLSLGLGAANPAQAVEIDYWQYTFETRVKAMDQLIAKFQQANPGITVTQTNFPMPITRPRCRPPWSPAMVRMWCSCSMAGWTASSPAS